MLVTQFRFSLFAACFLAWAPALLAQSELLPSASGIRNSRPDFGGTADYNLKFRAVTLKASAGLRAEYNDNIRLMENNPQSDEIISPDLSLAIFWPVTEFNALRFQTTVGYTKYLSHSDLDSSALTFSPDSALNFDIFIGQFTINLHDRFSITQDPTIDPGVSNVGNYGHLINTSGITGTWKVNADLALTLGYDHTLWQATTSDYEYNDFQQDQLFFSSRSHIADIYWGGVEASVASTRYNTSERGETSSTHAGLYAEAILSPYTRVRVAGGYQGIFNNGSNQEIVFDPQARQYVLSGNSEDAGDQNSYYFNAQISNRLSRSFDHALNVGHEVMLGATSDAIELNFARYSFGWRFNRLLGLSGDVLYEDGHAIGRGDGEHFKRLGAGVSTSYQVTRALSATLGYRYFHKDSDQFLQSYTQNSTYLSLRYDF